MSHWDIPNLDLQRFRTTDLSARKAFAADLGAAFRETGFAAIRGHLLDEALQADLLRVTKAFFALPDAVKERCHHPTLHGQRGYTAKRQEHAKDNPAPDLKEFYHVGNDSFGENLFPAEVADFERISVKAYEALEETGLLLLKAIALHLGLPEDYFKDKARGGNSILRLIHYFPLDQENLEPGAVRAAAHGDINLITLLMGASAAGLELLRADGTWVPITALPGYLIVNVGDMLARLTNEVLPSTVHRVINPENEDLSQPRFSMPFFLHPKPEMALNCLPECVSASQPKKYPDINAGDFLTQRLVEIGLIKS